MPTPQPPGGKEVLHIGPGTRRGRTVVIIAVCVVVLLGGVGWWCHGRASGTQPPPSSSPSPRPYTRPTPTTPSIMPGPPPQVSSVDLSWLRASAGWQLFARTENTHGALPGIGSVVRVQPGKGRVTQTAVPALDSSGPVAFVTRPGVAFVHPVDSVPAYVVPDGKPSRRSSSRVPDGGILLPGPKPNQVWVEQGRPQTTGFALVALPGGPTGITIPVPSSAQGFPFSDGAGHIMIPGTGGSYDLGHGSPERVTSGRVVAIGPKAWAVTTCKTQPPCRLTVVDPDSGKRRRLPGRLPATLAVGGQTSPDGAVAALLVYGDNPHVVLVDLDTGKATPTGVRTPRNRPVAIHGQGAMAWSPDGRWLFVVDADHNILAVDPHTGHARALGLHLPTSDGTIQQVVVRPQR